MSSDDQLSSIHPGLIPLLPEFEPDPALWDRIDSGNRRRVRRQRVFRLGGVSVSLALLAIIGFSAWPGLLDRQTDSYAVAEVRMHSQQLQDELISNRSGELDSDLRSRLRMVDSELQAAYDRGAGNDQLQSLWALRNRLLESSVRQNGDPVYELTRI